MSDDVKDLVMLASELSSLDQEILEKRLEIQKRIMRLSGLISLYKLKKKTEPPQDIIDLRDKLFAEYLEK